MFLKLLNAEKASKLEAKGDKLLAKGKVKRALKKFKRALELNPNRVEIYDKLMEVRDRIPGDWDMEDFVESVDWAMKKQEIEDPAIRHIHAKLSPEWEEARKLAIGIMAAEDEEHVEAMTERIVNMGEIGTRAVLSILVELRKASSQNEEAAPISEE